jgi:hypothetical protein
MATASTVPPPAAAPADVSPLGALTADALRELVARDGYAAAVDALYRAIAAAPPHAAFIRRVDTPAADLARAKDDLRQVRILIVPGALYREYPATGADGQRFVEVVRQLGVPCDTIPIQSFGRCEENGMLVTEWLAAHPPQKDERQILISFSKGSADVKAALLDPGNHPPFRRLTGWLSVGGILHGTPLVAWLRRHRLRHQLVRLWLRWRGLDHESLLQLAHGPGTPLDAPTVLPDGLRLVHFIALPGPADFSLPLARRAFERLLPLGPNDAGGLLLADLARLPGLLYPIRGTDHYMRGRADIPDRLVRVLHAMSSMP